MDDDYGDDDGGGESDDAIMMLLLVERLCEHWEVDLNHTERPRGSDIQAGPPHDALAS